MLTVHTVVPSPSSEVAVENVVDELAVVGRIGPDEPGMEEPAEPVVTDQESQSSIAVQVPAEQMPEQIPAEQPSTEPTAEQPQSDELFWAEVKLLGQLRECEAARDTIETTLAAHKETRARLQRELQHVETQIPKCEDLANESREQTLAVAKSLWKLKIGGVVPPAIETPTLSASSESVLAESAPEDESWRQVATRELLTEPETIPGLGKKKLESITDSAPTVGHLVDLISEGSKAHKQFHEMLPKGCGRGLADEIEKRIGDLVIRRSKEASAGTVSALADELLKDQRQTAASERWRPEDCQPSSDDSEHTKLGFAAFNEGKPHHALPTQNRELARQWMLGWVCAEVIKYKSDDSQPEADSEQPAAEPTAGSVLATVPSEPQPRQRGKRAKKAK